MSPQPSTLDQVDIAVDLGVVPPPLPEFKIFTYSQPVRVPGAWRNGKLQRLVWLRE
jgi:hypothetical protein